MLVRHTAIPFKLQYLILYTMAQEGNQQIQTHHQTIYQTCPIAGILRL